MPDQKLPTACVIGAGSSGIAAAKKLLDAGIEIDVFEKSDRVGGNWVFGNRNGMSAAYRSLHINTSRDRMEYADYPMPHDLPDFPHHTQIAAYFDSYVDHFGLREYIEFETGVDRAVRRDDGVWEITLEGDSVRFTDGSVEKVDVIVYCTGYKVTFPFFAESFISAPDNDLPLFRRTFHPDVPNVFFIGLLQPLGAIMPIAELQSEWVSDFLAGRYALPSPGDLRTDIDDERRRMFKRYVASKRHTMQIDFDDYVAALAKERKAGAERARAQANRLPVPPRAAAPVTA